MGRRIGQLGVSHLALALALSCGRATWDGQTYRNQELAFRLGGVPPAWQPIEQDLALLAYRDDRHDATIAVNGRCGRDGDDVPLTALTQHLFLHFTERRVVSQTRQELDGREALRSAVVAKLDGVPKKITIYVLKKDACVYDFILIARPEASAESAQDFDTFVQSFTTLRDAG